MFSKAIQNAIDRLAKLPGIGPRHATRLVFHMLKMAGKDVDGLAGSITMLKEKIKTCPVCFAIFEILSDEQKTCLICADPKRIKTSMCVIEKEADIEPIEKLGIFKGVYHVVGEHTDTLDKTVSPAVERLLERVAYIKKQLPQEKQKEMEIILATNATTEGDALASYLEKLLKPLGVTIAHLGRGLASGSELEYADEQTLAYALKNRK
ncbi:recombination protein RecR [Candidatus Azambacteria bacterium]|nr:recombination protein RecR [Candidatus Azambacteria bacterium]MBI3685667.1 recombination protein RecR [Candidatus Azambacteria bacterium]